MSAYQRNRSDLSAQITKLHVEFTSTETALIVAPILHKPLQVVSENVGSTRQKPEHTHPCACRSLELLVQRENKNRAFSCKVFSESRQSSVSHVVFSNTTNGTQCGGRCFLSRCANRNCWNKNKEKFFSISVCQGWREGLLSFAMLVSDPVLSQPWSDPDSLDDSLRSSRRSGGEQTDFKFNARAVKLSSYNHGLIPCNRSTRTGAVETIRVKRGGTSPAAHFPHALLVQFPRPGPAVFAQAFLQCEHSGRVASSACTWHFSVGDNAMSVLSITARSGVVPSPQPTTPNCCVVPCNPQSSQSTIEALSASTRPGRTVFREQSTQLSEKSGVYPAAPSKTMSCCCLQSKMERSSEGMWISHLKTWDPGDFQKATIKLDIKNWVFVPCCGIGNLIKETPVTENFEAYFLRTRCIVATLRVPDCCWGTVLTGTNPNRWQETRTRLVFLYVSAMSRMSVRSSPRPDRMGFSSLAPVASRRMSTAS